MKIAIVTEYEIIVQEYDPEGYFLRKYNTTVFVIADSASEACDKAIERVPLKKPYWAKRAIVVTAVVTAKDKVVREE